MRVYKITRPDIPGQFCVFQNWDTIKDELCETGDFIVITLLDMSSEDYDKLPEFEGW